MIAKDAIEKANRFAKSHRSVERTLSQRLVAMGESDGDLPIERDALDAHPEFKATIEASANLLRLAEEECYEAVAAEFERCIRPNGARQ